MANNTRCKTNDLIQSNRSVFLLLQNYSQAFPTVVSHWWWDKVALGKSVSKLLLAASASKARLIVVTWFFYVCFGLLYVRFQEWPKEGPLLESDSNKHQDQNRATIRVGLEKILGAKMGPLFESPPGPLLTSDMRPLDRYGTHSDSYTVTPLHRRLPATKQP